MQPLPGGSLWHLVWEGRSRRPGAGAIFKGEGAGKANAADEGQGVFEVGIGLAGEADNNVGGESDVGPRSADALHELGIVVSRVLAVHGGKDAVGARLKRKMQIGHELRLIGVERDEI